MEEKHKHFWKKKSTLGQVVQCVWILLLASYMKSSNRLWNFISQLLYISVWTFSVVNVVNFSVDEIICLMCLNLYDFFGDIFQTTELNHNLQGIIFLQVSWPGCSFAISDIFIKDSLMTRRLLYVNVCKKYLWKTSSLLI